MKFIRIKNLRSFSIIKSFKNSFVALIIMIIPIRCFSCGKPIAHLWEEYKKRASEGEVSKKVLDELGLERYCCRAMFLGQTDLIELVGKFKKS